QTRRRKSCCSRSRYTAPPITLKRRYVASAARSGCRFPGCTNRHYVDGHHIKHWANGGETRLSNLVLLCRFHHRQVHEGGVDVQVLDDGALRFVVKGRSFESPVPPREAAVTRGELVAVARGPFRQRHHCHP
ncbi:MAG: HNH endonuclease signature motif containing protein, partial [Gammaproteobacteria bacterium]